MISYTSAYNNKERSQMCLMRAWGTYTCIYTVINNLCSQQIVSFSRLEYYVIPRAFLWVLPQAKCFFFVSRFLFSHFLFYFPFSFSRFFLSEFSFFFPFSILFYLDGSLFNLINYVIFRYFIVNITVFYFNITKGRYL